MRPSVRRRRSLCCAAATAIAKAYGGIGPIAARFWFPTSSMSEHESSASWSSASAQCVKQYILSPSYQRTRNLALGVVASEAAQPASSVRRVRQKSEALHHPFAEEALRSGHVSGQQILLGTRRRPASDADEAFCFELNEASMRKYVEPIYGWDADVQRAYHARWFQPARLTIVEDDDAAWNRWVECSFPIQLRGVRSAHDPPHI